jgi:hypothetical protein
MLPLSPSIGLLELMLVLVLGASLELWLTARGTRREAGPGASRRWSSVYAPLLRGSAIVAAVLWAYPALFGFRAAPSLRNLFASDAPRLALLLGLVVLLRLCTQRLAALRRRPGLVDSLQAMVAVAVVFEDFADYLGALSASAWPGLVAALALGGLSLLLPALASGLGRDLGARGNSALAAWLDQALGMAAVAPIVMFYAYLLGTQLGM